MSTSSSSLSLSDAMLPTMVKSLSITDVLALAPPSETDIQVVREEGLPHARIKLGARHYKSHAFASDLLKTIRTVKISSWVAAEDLKIQKVSGSLTNAVFFVSCPARPEAHTLLLRIYGPSSGSLISRPRELHILHILSSKYRIGPRIYGTFENGRIEEYFDSTTLTASDLRKPTISRWIGARMAELHSVDIEEVEETSEETRGEGKGWEIAAKKNVRSWLGYANEVLALPRISMFVRDELDLDSFKAEWNTYMAWLSQVDDVHNGSRRVFAHNDTQYGNLLRVTQLKKGLPEHRQIIVVDFEYASPNPASFDIANHFHEWTANYHGPTPHLLDHTRYPTRDQRRNFYSAYYENIPYTTLGVKLSKQDQELRLDKMDEQVKYWSPASHAMWAVWGIVQARDDVENGVEEPEFDYIAYARCRMAGFRREIKALGL